MRERVFVAGHNGMVGSAILKSLKHRAHNIDILTASRKDLNLLDQAAVNSWFSLNKPSQVYLAAAKVGGIHANNTYPAEFIYENLMIQTNVISAAHNNNVQKLLFLGSSCIYPKYADQPMREDVLLTGVLEPTNEPYAIAKIAGIKLCESFNRQYGRDYRSVMPTNLYGPNDNYHPEDSHVIPALIRRFHEAKVHRIDEVEIWGSGKPRREFLHVDDMASASIHVMGLERSVYQNHTSAMISHINVGSGSDCTILELAKTIAEVVKYKGRISFDSTKPDGSPRKLMDSSKLISLGWRPKYDLTSGLHDAYKWFLENSIRT